MLLPPQKKFSSPGLFWVVKSGNYFLVIMQAKISPKITSSSISLCYYHNILFSPSFLHFRPDFSLLPTFSGRFSLLPIVYLPPLCRFSVNSRLWFVVVVSDQAALKRYLNIFFDLLGELYVGILSVKVLVKIVDSMYRGECVVNIT